MKLRGEVIRVERRGDKTVVVARCRRVGAADTEQGDDVGFSVPTQFADLYHVGRGVDVDVVLSKEKTKR